MITTSDLGVETHVFIWFAQPHIGRESLLMALTNDPKMGLSFKPLMSIDQAVAAEMQQTAQAAATDLGCAAVLREFEYVSLLDRVSPGAPS